jgi:hypothetical protein
MPQASPNPLLSKLLPQQETNPASGLPPIIQDAIARRLQLQKQQGVAGY